MIHKNPRLFNVYSTEFRVSITSRGLKVNHLDQANTKKAVGPAVWGTWKEVTGVSGEDCYYDMTPGQISAFIRRKIFGKDIPIPAKEYHVDCFGQMYDLDEKPIYV